MGKKPLAYKIAKQTEAEYFLFNFDANPVEILTLDRKLRLEQEAVLRHLLIKTKPVKESKKAKVKVESLFQNGNVSSEKKEEASKIEAKPKVTVTTKVTTKPQAKVTTKKKVAKVTKVAKGKK
jgi:hypothetical protein